VIYRFDTFELDTRTLELRDSGELVAIQRKVFDVLLYLVEHRDRVVWKDELLREIWPNEKVVESAVHRAASLLRRTLKQTDRSTPIETIYGRGYRFRASVSELSEPGGAPELPKRPAGASTTPTSLEEPAPFVGRTYMLRQLFQGVQRARQSEGGMFLLSGESGIGKTRIAEHVWRHAAQLGGRLWKGSCSEISGAPETWPWVQILRSCLDEFGGEADLARRGHALIAQLAPERDAVGGLMPPAADAAAAKFRLFDDLTRFLVDACRFTPNCLRVLWIDDLPPRSVDSFHILDLLGASLHRVPLLVIVALKSEPSGVRALRLDRVPDSMHRIELPRLTAAEVAEYVALSAPIADPAALSARLFEKTEGNPLFVTELLRHLLLTQERDRLSDTDLCELPLPTAIHELAERQLQDIPEQTRRILELGAVAGREFNLALLERAAPVGGVELFSQLDLAVERGLIHREGTGRSYRFAQGVIRETLYRSLDVDRTAQMHLTLAEALEGHVNDSAELGNLAFHCVRALPMGSPARAVRYAVEAALTMCRSGAYSDAARYVEWALEAQTYVESLKPVRRCELLALAASIENGAGNAPQARRYVSDLVDLAGRHRLGAFMARAGLLLRGASVAHQMEPDPLARTAFEQARQLLPADEVEARVRVLSRLSWLPPYAHDRERRLALVAEASSLCTEERSIARFEVLMARVLAFSAPNDAARAREAAEELLAYNLGQPDTVWAAKAHLIGCNTFLRLGDNDRAARELLQLGRTARELRLQELIWTHDRLDLQASYYDGDMARLPGGISDLYTRSQRLKIRFGARYAHTMQALLQRETGALLDPPIPAPSDVPPMAHRPPLLQARAARTLAEGSDPSHAKVHLARLGRTRFNDLPDDAALLATLAELTQCIVALETGEYASDVLARLGPYRQHVAVDEFSISLGSAAYFCGLLNQLLGDRLAARADFEAALEANLRLRHLPQIARTKLSLGQWLCTESDAAERRRGIDLLTEVYDEADAHGLKVIATQARQQLQLAEQRL